MDISANHSGQFKSEYVEVPGVEEYCTAPNLLRVAVIGAVARTADLLFGDI